jgi:hypothetical protein
MCFRHLRAMGFRPSETEIAPGIDESGLGALESSLIDYLLKEKSSEFLLTMCDRVLALLQAPTAVSQHVELAQGARALRQGILRDARRAPETRLPLQGGSLAQLRPCEICAHISKVQWDFLCRFQYDLGTSHAWQVRFAEAGGLCSFHTWQYEPIASPLGVCTGFPPLLDRLAKGLRAGVAGPRYADELPSNGCECIMCTISAQAEAQSVALTAASLEEDPRRVDTLSAICLPHLGMLLAKIDDGHLFRRILDREAAILERLSEDMKRYALKRDAVRQHLLSEEESRAAQAALLLLAGHRNVNAISRTDRVRGTPLKTATSAAASGVFDNASPILETDLP